MTAVAADARIAGRYRLIEPVGAGGMGTVWRAVDERLDRTVAIKLLHPDYATDRAALSRFSAEARAAASISHPHVVGVFDYGEEPAEGGGARPFLVMELVPGRSLARELADRGTLSSEETSDIVGQTALGLAAAHAVGLVHRDIKPGNLLLAPDGTVKITDFGIARAADTTAITRTGTMVGTAQYLAPEQAEGRSATPASDLYSLGLVAFACLTGDPPFIRETAVATLLAQVRDPVPPLPPTIPVALRTLVGDLLAKDPARRPAPAAEVAARARSVDHGSVARPEPVAGGGRPAGAEPAATRRLAPADVTQLLDRTDVLSDLMPAGTETADRPLAAPRWQRIGARFPRRSPGRVAVAAATAGAVALIVALTALSAGPHTTTVPAVTGSSLDAARRVLAHDGLAVQVRTEDAPGHRAQEVVAESPVAGTRLAAGKPVVLTVASGTVNVDAAALTGLSYTAAAATLNRLGLHPTEVYDTSTATPGTVVSVTPSGQTPTGTTVTVGVAAAPPPAVTTAPTTPAPAATPAGGHGPHKGHGKNG